MADPVKPAKAAGSSTPADTAGTRHDEVVALSIRNDGSLDQTAPEIIGPVDGAIEATKAQFAQMAVSAKDGYELREEQDAEAEARAGDDPVIAKRIKEHEAAVKAAEAKAEQVVKALAR